MYLVYDVIEYLTKYCDFRTILNLYKANRYTSERLENIIKLKISKLPWRLCIEYDIKNGVNIHCINLAIGYITINDRYQEQCDICLGGRWKKHRNNLVCYNDNLSFGSKHIRITIFTGTGPQFINKLNYMWGNYYLPIYLSLDYDTIVPILTPNNNDDLFYDEIFPVVCSLDKGHLCNIDTDKDKIISAQSPIEDYADITEDEIITDLEYKTQVTYSGYSSEFYEDILNYQGDVSDCG
jgi:hypothetical protein